MRLLIAEDERELARALKTIFEKHNYGVDVVYDKSDPLHVSGHAARRS